MAVKRRGWVINIDRDDATREVESTREPVLTLDDGEIVFEVWKWHAGLRRWFVLASRPDPAMEAQGVVYYAPHEIPHGLRSRMLAMEKAVGLLV